MTRREEPRTYSPGRSLARGALKESVTIMLELLTINPELERGLTKELARLRG